jgi:hypothetical protein
MAFKFLSVQDVKHSGQPRTGKTIENVEKLENSHTEIITDQSMSSQTPFGSVMEFARRS